jgi:hypothetical protein
MGIIRQRVASRGAVFDAFPGLGLKCFLIGEKGRSGAASNQYAPVYLWPRAEHAWGFLAGPAFAAIKESFGAPAIETWVGFAFARSGHLDNAASIAAVSRSEQTLHRETDLIAQRQYEIGAARAAVDNTPGLLARVVGIDPRSWSLVYFDYWGQAALPAGLDGYEVLHVAAPDFNKLEETRPA